MLDALEHLPGAQGGRTQTVARAAEQAETARFDRVQFVKEVMG
jgi:hypothetical protein